MKSNQERMVQWLVTNGKVEKERRLIQELRNVIKDAELELERITDGVLSERAAAKYLGCSRSTLRLYRSRGFFPGVVDGTSKSSPLLYLKIDLDAFKRRYRWSKSTGLFDRKAWKAVHNPTGKGDAEQGARAV